MRGRVGDAREGQGCRTRGAAGAVAEGRGDAEVALAAHLHALETLVPALDHLAPVEGEVDVALVWKPQTPL